VVPNFALMKKYILLPAFLLIFNLLSAQNLPEVDLPVVSKNYLEICTQLDEYFKTEYRPEEDAIEMFDAMGRLVISKMVSSLPISQLIVDVSQLSAGMYFLRVADHSGQMLVAERVAVGKRD